MKKNKSMRLAAVLLVLVLLTTSVIGGTFAKYTGAAEATDSARVAKWDIQLNGQSITKTFNIDLFNTVYDENGTDAEDHIKVADGSIIAPGTAGSFDIDLTNNSEVTAEYTIDYTVSNPANIPVKFSLDGTDWKDSIDDLDVTTPETIAIGETESTITVYWQWVFNGDDNVDTALGLKGTNAIIVSAKVTVDQVD